MLFTGKGAAFDGGKKIRMTDIRDGTSDTILCVEAGPDKAVPWTKPEDLPFDPEKPLAALGKVSPEGFIAAFFDGSVQQLKVDNQTLKALITPDGGERIDLCEVARRAVRNGQISYFQISYFKFQIEYFRLIHSSMAMEFPMRANRVLTAMSAAAFLIAGPSYGRASDAAGPTAIDVSLVTPDDFAAIVIRPRRIAQLPLLADLLKDEMVAGAIKKFDKIVEAFKKNAPPLVVAYLDAAKTVQGGTVTFNLTGPALVHVVLDAKDAAAAGNVEELLQQALRMAGGGLMLAKQGIPKDAQATLGPLVKLAEQLVDGAKTAKSGSQVTLDFKRPQEPGHRRPVDRDHGSTIHLGGPCRRPPSPAV